MALSVAAVSNALARCRIRTPDEVRDLHQRWTRAAGAQAADAEAFLRWLGTKGILSEYQIGVLSRGNADQLILGPYSIEDRIGKGRMAGVYRARHRTGQVVAIKILPPSKAR